MIYAFTGQPGAGKTLNAIKFTLEDKAFIDKRFEVEKGKAPNRRPVYYYGIKDLNIDSWTELTKEEILNWWELEEGCVIVIDECQDIWRPRTPSQAVPMHVQQLEKHRHLGIDFILTFQFPTQIDVVVRHLVTDHFHFHRALGLESSTRYKWDTLVTNVKSKAEHAKAEVSIVPFDKKIFDLYHSASLHTSVKRIPWKTWLIIPIVFFLMWIVSQLYKTYSSYKNGTVVADHFEQTQINGGFPITPQNDLTIVDEGSDDYYFRKFRPRVANDPSSAPIYDDIKKVVSFPVPNCIYRVKTIRNKPSCLCYSQQGTRMAIEAIQCLSYIKNGYAFDYTKSDSSNRRERFQRAPVEQSAEDLEEDQLSFADLEDPRYYPKIDGSPANAK